MWHCVQPLSCTYKNTCLYPLFPHHAGSCMTTWRLSCWKRCKNTILGCISKIASQSLDFFLGTPNCFVPKVWRAVFLLGGANVNLKRNAAEKSRLRLLIKQKMSLGANGTAEKQVVHFFHHIWANTHIQHSKSHHRLWLCTGQSKMLTQWLLSTTVSKHSKQVSLFRVFRVIFFAECTGNNWVWNKTNELCVNKRHCETRISAVFVVKINRHIHAKAAYKFHILELGMYNSLTCQTALSHTKASIAHS